MKSNDDIMQEKANKIARFFKGKPIDKNSPKGLWYTPYLAPHHHHRLHPEVFKRGYYSEQEEWVLPLIEELDKLFRADANLCIKLQSEPYQMKHLHQSYKNKISPNTTVFILEEIITFIQKNRCSHCESSFRILTVKCNKCGNAFCTNCYAYTCHCQQYLK